MDRRAWDQIEQTVIACCEALLAASGVAADHASASAVGAVADRATAAFIGFAGAHLRGSLLLGVDDAILARSYPTARGAEVQDVDRQDWSRELVNQLLGRVKNRLLGFGVVIELGTPMSLSGTDLCVGPPAPGVRCMCHAFASEGAWVHVRLDAIVAPGLELTAPDATACDLAEGDTILF